MSAIDVVKSNARGQLFQELTIDEIIKVIAKNPKRKL